MNLDSFRSEYDVVPIVRRLTADTITPVAAFEALSELAIDAFLLESVERGENVGRYSFIGVAPRRRLVFERDCPNPVPLLRDELVPLRVFEEENLPPFFGGAVGFFGYGVGRWSERLPDALEAGPDIPDAVLLFIDQVICFDHVKQELIVVANILTRDERSSAELLEEAERKLDLLVERLKAARVDLIALDNTNELGENTRPWESNVTREQFEATVRDAKEEILAGEIFQIVLSQRWETSFATNEALALYRSLRTINPSPYMFLLRTEACTLVGSSPEMLVRLDGGVAETRPIAGTRPRGRSSDEDLALERELVADPKENAEHLMLVDLGRNDLGRVCKSGTVKVTQYAGVERYSHVMHLVSNVAGELRDDVRAIDLFLSAFPAGTVSGAPKIRAMELIDHFEVSRRGPYAGAVAYFGFSGSLDSCISIRTVVLKDDVAYVQAGAGIVFDSIPSAEYEETVNKSTAIRNAVELTRRLLTREPAVDSLSDSVQRGAR